jgi:hypothetical protein
MLYAFDVLELDGEDRRGFLWVTPALPMGDCRKRLARLLGGFPEQSGKARRKRLPILGLVRSTPVATFRPVRKEPTGMGAVFFRHEQESVC